MRFKLSASFLVICALSACGPAPAPADLEKETASVEPAPLDPEAPAAEQATLASCGPVTAQGYCGVTFGMTPEQASRSFPVGLESYDGADPDRQSDPNHCFEMFGVEPVQSVSFLVEGRKVGRVDFLTETPRTVDAYNDVGGNIIAVDEVPQDRVNQYGVIDPVTAGDQGPLVKMKGMVEKPPIEQAPSRLKITGRYILQPQVFDLLATQTPGAGGEIQLTDAMQRLMGSQDFHAFKYAGQDYDCGDKLLYLEAFAAMALAHPELGAKAKAVLENVLKKG